MGHKQSRASPRSIPERALPYFRAGHVALYRLVEFQGGVTGTAEKAAKISLCVTSVSVPWVIVVFT